jgi:phosphopentomutase
MPWVGKTHLTDDFHPLFDEGISEFVITDPEKYMTKEQWEQSKAEEQAVVDAKVESDNSIMEFLKSSNLLKASINNNTLEVEDKFNEAKLEVVGFGEAKDIMAEIGINESAIGDMDSTLKQFNNMLGEMRAIPINEYIVIFHPSQSNVLITKQI